MTPSQIATLRELADDLSHIVQAVSSRDGDATARQHARAEAVQAALTMVTSIGSPIENAIAQRNTLRAALVGLIGVDGKDDLKALEATMRLMPAPAADKAASIDAIHALLETLP